MCEGELKGCEVFRHNTSCTTFSEYQTRPGLLQDPAYQPQHTLRLVNTAETGCYSENKVSDMLLSIKLWHSHLNLAAEQLELYLNRCVLPCLQLLHLETNVFEHLKSRYVGIWCGHLSVINSRTCFKWWPHGTCGASLWWSALNGGYLDYAAMVDMTHDLNSLQSYLDLFHKFLLWWHFELFLLKSLPAAFRPEIVAVQDSSSTSVYYFFYFCLWT